MNNQASSSGCRPNVSSHLNVDNPPYDICSIVDRDITDISFIHNKCSTEMNYKCNWFSTTEPIKLRNQFCSSKLGLLFSSINNLLNLRYLRIWGECESIRPDDLNKFTKLQILVLRGCYISSGHLQLPDLKALSIDIWMKESDNLVIETPKLHSLYIHDYNLRRVGNQIKFKHLLSIKYLLTHTYNESVLIFKNLECLEIYFSCGDLSTDDLLELNNLKKLKIDGYFLDQKIGKLKDLYKLKKNDLEIVLCGVKIKKINKFDDLFKSIHRLELQLNNYGDLEDDLHFVERIDYNDLIDVLPDNQPADLCNKYTNIQEISVDGMVEDENRLFNLIKGCPNLYKLHIRDLHLSQLFYDQLPSICSLTCLTTDTININHKFVNKMNYLVVLNVGSDVKLGEDLNLNNLEYLKYFNFKIGNESIEIIKGGRDNYKVKTKISLSCDEYCSLEDLIKHINNLRRNMNLEGANETFKRIRLSL